VICIIVAAMYIISSSGPVGTLEDFEPEEALDASFLDDTPLESTKSATAASQPDVPSDS